MSEPGRPQPSYARMRRLAQSSAMAHACVALRANQVAAADWDIRVAGGDPDWHRRAVLAFDHPVRNLRFPAWASRIVTEVMTTDTLCLHVRHPPAYWTADPEVSGLPILELLDGARIVPRPALLGLSGLPGLDGTEGDAAILAAAGFETIAPGDVQEITDEMGRTTGGTLREFLKDVFDQILAGWPGAPSMEFGWALEPDWAEMTLPAAWETWPRE